MIVNGKHRDALGVGREHGYTRLAWAFESLEHAALVELDMDHNLSVLIGPRNLFRTNLPAASSQRYVLTSLGMMQLLVGKRSNSC